MNKSAMHTKYFVTAAVAILLAGCASKQPAPVSDARPPADAARPPVIVRPATPTVPPTAGQPATPLKVHVIQRGETMRSIAALYGIDYRELAAWNNIENASALRPGDTLRLTRPDTLTVTGAPVQSGTPSTGDVIATPLVLTPTPASDPNAPVTPSPLPSAAPSNSPVKTEPRAGKVPYSDSAYNRMLVEGTVTSAPAAVTTPVPVVVTPPAVAPTPIIAPIVAPSIVPSPVSAPVAGNGDPDWGWPVKGSLLARFTEGNRGIDIAGTKGTPVLAAAAGKVSYYESNIRGYGRLLIIKHNETWLSAYAHNDKVLVKVGDEIKKGQKIAEMGASDADRVKLHFEIRKNGRPLDPMKYLPAQ